MWKFFVLLQWPSLKASWKKSRPAFKAAAVVLAVVFVLYELAGPAVSVWLRYRERTYTFDGYKVTLTYIIGRTPEEAKEKYDQFVERIEQGDGKVIKWGGVDDELQPEIIEVMWTKEKWPPPLPPRSRAKK